MSRRLPADNGVTGRDECDDPGRVLGGRALVGRRVHLGPSTALPMGSSLNWRRPAQPSSISENTAPIILMSDFLPGKTCTTQPRRLGSRLARYCTLLVRSLTWCS